MCQKENLEMIFKNVVYIKIFCEYFFPPIYITFKKRIHLNAIESTIKMLIDIKNLFNVNV